MKGIHLFDFGSISDNDYYDYTLIHALETQSDYLFSNAILYHSVDAAKLIDYAKCSAT